MRLHPLHDCLEPLNVTPVHDMDGNLFAFRWWDARAQEWCYYPPGAIVGNYEVIGEETPSDETVGTDTD